MLHFKEGDRVRIVERIPTAADIRTGLYYAYYGGLAGTVFKIYGKGEAAQAAVDVDIETLPEEIARRHLAIRDEMRSSLPGEARRTSAPGTEHEFRLRYVVLVAVSDLTRKPSPAVRSAVPARSNGKKAMAGV